MCYILQRSQKEGEDEADGESEVNQKLISFCIQQKRRFGHISLWKIYFKLVNVCFIKSIKCIDKHLFFHYRHYYPVTGLQR